MKPSRRQFFKVVAGGLGYIAMAAIIPAGLTLAQFKPKDKHPKDVLACKDFTPNITIQDYKPGEPIKYQDLNLIIRKCSNCVFESNCTCVGQKYVTNKPGKFIPEIWNKKLQRRWYENSGFKGHLKA